MRYSNNPLRLTGGLCGPLSGRRLLSGRRRPARVLRDPPLPRVGDQLHRVAARLLHHHERHQPDHCHHPGDPGQAAEKEAPPTRQLPIVFHLAFLLRYVRWVQTDTCCLRRYFVNKLSLLAFAAIQGQKSRKYFTKPPLQVDASVCRSDRMPKPCHVVGMKD